MRIYSFDMETTALNAIMGRVLCASFYPIIPAEFHPPRKQKQLRPITFSCRQNEYKGEDVLDDRALCVAIRDFIHHTPNVIVTWNGKLFDVPFLNARLGLWGETICRPQFHMDMMYYARGAGARIGSSKLDNVQKFFKLDDEKTVIDWNDWARARAGVKRAMIPIEEHCEQDVKVLEQVYWRLLPHVANVHR